MSRRGFTIVELVIVIAIMGILLGLGFNNFRSTQISSRDTERKTDIETLSQFLNVFYNSGTDAAGPAPTPTFDYPPIGTTGLTVSSVTMVAYLRDIDPSVLTAPGVTDPTQTLTAATNNTQTTAGVTPQPTYNQYVYQPLQPDGTLCTTDAQECRKYNLYYRLEADNTVYMVTSKYQ